jgi:predicted PurR-regulated permease PerM
MFTLPSIWNILISTIVFVIAAWYIRRKLDEHGLPKGMTRGLLVFVLAYMVAWGAGELVDWAHDKIYGVTPPSQLEQDVNQLVNDSGLILP